MIAVICLIIMQRFFFEVSL